MPELVIVGNDLFQKKIAGKMVLVVVDDGSPDSFLSHIADFRFSPNVEVHIVRHPINLGQGASLQTGIEYLRQLTEKVGLFITMDADGQHSPADIEGLISELKKLNADIIFGNRFSKDSLSNVPFLRKILLKLAIQFESFLTGIRLSDAHNGFRCFNRKFALAVALRQNRMAHATEFKQLVQRGNFIYAEAPVTIKYRSDLLEKGQSNLNSLNILKDLLKVYLFERL